MQRLLQVSESHGVGFKACEAQFALGARCAEGLQRGEEVEAGTEAKFGDVKPIGEAVWQVVARQKDMLRFGQPIIERIIGIVEAGRDRDRTGVGVAPFKLCGLVGHGDLP